MLVALAAAAAGGTFAATSYASASRPDSVVRSYFAALARGDASAALGYGVVPSGPTQLLTDDVVKAQNAVARMSDVQVLSVERTGSTARVDIRYMLRYPSGDRIVNDTVPVMEHGSGWRLTSSAVPVSVEVEQAADLARLAGAKVPSGTVLMLPGVLPVSFAVPALRVSGSGPVVEFANPGPVQVGAAVSAAGQRSSMTALNSALSSCLTGAANAPAACPLPLDDRAVPGSLRGAVPSLSAMTLTVADDGDIVADDQVTVHGSYQQLDFNNQPAAKSGDIIVQLSAEIVPRAVPVVVWDVS